jgi:hypothetical protein
MPSKTITFEILMLPHNDIRIAAAVYAIRLANNNAQRFFRIAGMNLQTY